MESPSEVVIVPHTHWDREWYQPFQKFRTKLVELIDYLIDILTKQDYYFMLDGQTIVLEDYFEIRPENKTIVLDLIREGKLALGPWYLLPDEWLVGEESLIRNLEISYNIAREFDIPLMKIAYLPDQFGHSQAIPQIIGDLTEMNSTVLWRGVGHEISTVPFRWKGHESSESSILGIYMPFGYSNAATLPEIKEELEEEIYSHIKELDPFSPLPVYLLMNGTDHQFPNPNIKKLISDIDFKSTNVTIGLLQNYLDKLQGAMDKANYEPKQYIGEFRSSARAPLLQNTYSSRMWIKIWNQKAEDLLVNYAEPICTLASFYGINNFPSSFLNLSWKWLLKNHPHDSICGCSIDQTHEEMKSRFSWSETISESLIADTLETIKNTGDGLDNSRNYIHVFNHTNSGNIPQEIEFRVPSKIPVVGLRGPNGEEYVLQTTKSSEEVVLDENISPKLMKSGMKMLPGRKLMDFYINEVSLYDGADPRTCEIRLAVANKPVGEFDVKAMKKTIYKILDSKKFGKYHVIASKGSEQAYVTMAPLVPFAFTRFEIVSKLEKQIETSGFNYNKKGVENKFYDLNFNKDGSFSLFDKVNNIQYHKLHQFEDVGDRGDLYSFGKVEPVVYKVSKVKRKIRSKGAIIIEIEQKLNIITSRELHTKREKREGRVKIPVRTVFRFYRDLARIDIETTLINTAKDHRLRICFNLPYSSDETMTATHFGIAKRKAQPDMNEDYIEQPSGIQAQKRFIRVEGRESAFTLINKGLPEVELLNSNILAMTLLRSVGHLSRSDFPERPIQAGPSMETPGAQDLGTSYTFNYSLITHSINDDVTFSQDHSEVFSLPTSVGNGNISNYLFDSIFKIGNPMIRVSSFREIEGDVLLTLYNLVAEKMDCEIELHRDINHCSSVKINRTIKTEHKLENRILQIQFKPMEIMMLKFSKK